MSNVNRRAFLGVSIAGLAALGSEGKALAAVRTRAATGATGTVGAPSLQGATDTVVAPPLRCAPANLPSRLAVDCSVGRNVRLFLKSESLFGLTGVVSMTAVHSELGNHAGGSLFLYPWLKTQATGAALVAQLSQYQAFLPGPIPANPLPNFGAPLDEEFCTYGLQAPAQHFIGFAVDVPRTAQDLHLPWYSMVDRVAGQTVGVDWSSSNLNGPWFGGSHAIPASDECNGLNWRNLIVAALRQAAIMAC